LLGGWTHRPDWTKESFALIKSVEFLTLIVKFEPTKVKGTVKAFIQKTYLESSEMEYDPVAFKRASNVLGPLTMWLKSSIRYADIVTKIDPLRKELAGLEQEAEVA